MKKLNYIVVDSASSLLETCDFFISQILENSKETLQEVELPKFCIPDVCFPKLKTLALDVGMDITSREFEIHFENALKNMERLEKIELCTQKPKYQEICRYVAEKYEKYCISAEYEDLRDVLNLIPIKILTLAGDLEELSNAKYTNTLQYLHAYIEAELPMEDGWENYKQIFDQFSNLKAIELDPVRSDWEHFITDVLPNLSEPNKDIWEERISYFQKRDIRIVGKNKIYENEKLKKRLAKEAGLNWRFHIY
jgi:rRNA-processing protein FCF1